VPAVTLLSLKTFLFMTSLVWVGGQLSIPASVFPDEAKPCEEDSSKKQRNQIWPKFLTFITPKTALLN